MPTPVLLNWGTCARHGLLNANLDQRMTRYLPGGRGSWNLGSSGLRVHVETGA